jgi:hypothetical protein
LVLAIGALGACGGGGDGGGSQAASTVANVSTTTEATTVATPTTVSRANELPKFIGEFSRVCKTQIGYLGASSYEKVPGVHPVVFFEDFRGEGFIESSRTLPAGWAVEQDTNFDDASELKAAQLVACSDRVKETPTGVKCKFDDNGTPIELELVDATYDLKVYAATSGEVKHQQTLEAKNSKCPFIATFKKGDTTFVNQPSDDDYTNALKSVVAVA